MKSWLMLCAVVCAFSVQSLGMILPPNNLGRLDDFKVRNIKPEEFNKIVDSIVGLWQPIAKLHGAQLVAEKKWDDSTVNAYATQSGNVWKVTFFGGLARRPEVTPDAFALVVCHELGHHFGGHYFYNNEAWAAAEGQADYFATQVCGKEVFKRFSRMFNNRYFRLAEGTYVEKMCTAAWKTPEGRDVCIRQSLAGQGLANLLAALGKQPAPQFDKPDQKVVPKTNVNHPEAQCRLDTYFQGALCTAPFDVRVIPAKDMGPGKNNTFQAQVEAAKYSCFKATGFEVGSRPACWFKTQSGRF